MTTLAWPVEEDRLPAVETPEERARLADALDAAVATLWALTGRRYAIRRVVARPSPRIQDTEDAYTLGTYSPIMVPVLDGGRWRNVACTGGGLHQSDGPGSVLLPGPVVRVEGVNVGGDLLDASSYSLEGDRLRRTAGVWPSQDLSLPLPLEGTWSVTYLRGMEPPPGAAGSVAALAIEFYNAVARPDECRLPRNWQSVSRQGVSIQRIDPRDLAEMGMTGLPEVDLWVRAINPHGLAHARASVASVDTLGGN